MSSVVFYLLFSVENSYCPSTGLDRICGPTDPTVFVLTVFSILTPLKLKFLSLSLVINTLMGAYSL